MSEAIQTEKLEFAAGYIYTTDQAGNRVKHSIANMLRAADIPTGLTYSQVQAITGLANILGVLIKELVEQEVIKPEFMDGFDLGDIIEEIDNAGGSYTEPDIGIDT